MKPFLHRFILSFPVHFVKQYPYAWILCVILTPRAPSLAAFFLVVVLLGIVLPRWQSAAWISEIRRQYAGSDGKFYVDQPPLSWQRTARNMILLVLGSIFIAYLLKGPLQLTLGQFLSLGIGLAFSYLDTQFFDSVLTYIVTATGIAIHFVPGHVDYRLFLPFQEISRIERASYKPSLDTDLFARSHDKCNGLLMIPKNPKGFTRQIDKLFIVPKDVDQFVEQLPYGFGETA